MGIQMSMMDTAMSTVQAMPPDCPMHAQAQASTVPEDLSTVADTKCAHCHFCIPLAPMAEPFCGIGAHAMHVQPLTGGGNFHSAALELALKPPIS